MTTTINIEGGRMNLVKRSLLSLIGSRYIDLSLKTEYQNVPYEFGWFGALTGTTLPLSLDLMFFRKKGAESKNVTDSPLYLILRTDGKGRYNLLAYPCGSQGYVNLDDGLSIEVSKPADEAIRTFASSLH